MFVQEDFKHLRRTPTTQLQWFPKYTLKKQKKKKSSQLYEQGYSQYFKAIGQEFMSSSSMHGMDRIFSKTLDGFKRLTWIVGFLLCFCVFLYVSFRVAYSYHTKPLVTVVSATHYAVFRIPFPEVTICNRNRFNWGRFEMAKRIFLKPRHLILPQYQDLFMEVVNAYDTLSFGKFSKFENVTKVPPSMLQELSYINFQSVAEFMAWRCHEIFSICIWLDDDYSCCDIFFLRNSQLGSCLAFNTIESPDGLDKRRFDSFWPWRTKGQGIYNGLGVRIHIREQDHSPRRTNKKGILVMLAEPGVWFTAPVKVDTHTRTSISIKGSLHTYHDYTRVISSKVRQCLFEDELNNKYYKSLADRSYMFENCRAQCQLEYLVKYCNCTVDLFYPPGPYRPCRLADYPCLFYHNEKFLHFEENAETEYNVPSLSSDSMKCTCFYNCNSLLYVTTVTTAYMSNTEVDFNNSFIDLDVFFQKEFLTVYLTTVLYTFADLMASFGGLASLCIGCSLLSLVEIVYFFIIDIPHKTLLYIKMKKYFRLQRKSRNAKADVIESYLRI